MARHSWTLLVTASALALAGSAAAPATAQAEGAPVAGGSAAGGWGPVTTLVHHPRGEALAADPTGTTTVVWATWAAPHDVVNRHRTPAGHWSAPVVIGHGYAPQVATDARGDVIVAWLTQRRGFTDGVALARHPRGGHWSHPVHLTRDLQVPGYVPNAEGPYGAAHIAVAMNARGAAVVAWDWGSTDRSKPWRIASVYRPAGGSFGHAVRVTPADGANTPQVGLGDLGNATLLYQHQAQGHPQSLVSVRRILGGWARPITVVHQGYDPTLAVDHTGRAVVAYTPNFNRVQVVQRPPRGAAWGTPRALSPQGVQINDFAMAANAAGTTMVAWARGNGLIETVTRPAGGAWAAPTTVATATGPAAEVVAALGARGDGFVGWGEYALTGADRPHGGAWSAPFVISPDAGVEVLESLHAAVTAVGDVVVLWKQEDLPLKVRSMTAG
jgi:hypothetical protein